MGAFVNFNAGKRVRLGRYVAVLGDEQQALLSRAERIVCPEGHGACGLADGGSPDARALPGGARPQRSLGAAAPIDARHAGLEQFQQQLAARIVRTHVGQCALATCLSD
jgi:hypothetical protein